MLTTSGVGIFATFRAGAIALLSSGALPLVRG